MSEDFFALLGETRRPWLEPEQIKEKFHDLSRTAHPDQQSENGVAFALLNQAQAALRDPKARLRHLLELEYPQIRLSGPTSVPGELADLFAPVHGLIREIDAILTRKSGAPSALAKALLARDEWSLRELAERRLEELEALQNAAVAELRAFDAEWTLSLPDRGSRLHAFYQRFAYLSRWITQLRERLFQLGL